MIRYNVIQDYWWQYCTSHTAVYVLGVIVAARGGCYAWGQERLAKESHCTPRTVRRVTAQLEQAGLITIIDNDKRFNRTSYTATALALSWDKMSSDTEDKMSSESGQNVLRQEDKMSSDTEDKMSAPYNNVAKTVITNTITNTEQIPPIPPTGEVRDRYGRVLEVWVETYRQNVGKDYIDTYSVTNDLKKLIGKVATAMFKTNLNAGVAEQEAHPTDDEVVETMRGFFLSAYQKGGKLTQDNWDIAYINRYFQKLFVITDNNTTNYDKKYSAERIERLRRAGFIR